jgi:hypothetical protein
VLARAAQQIALPQEADLGRLLGLGCGFILAPRNYSGDSQWATALNDSTLASAFNFNAGRSRPRPTN